MHVACGSEYLVTSLQTPKARSQSPTRPGVCTGISFAFQALASCSLFRSQSASNRRRILWSKSLRHRTCYAPAICLPWGFGFPPASVLLLLRLAQDARCSLTPNPKQALSLKPTEPNLNDCSLQQVAVFLMSSSMICRYGFLQTTQHKHQVSEASECDVHGFGWCEKTGEMPTQICRPHISTQTFPTLQVRFLDQAGFHPYKGRRSIELLGPSCCSKALVTCPRQQVCVETASLPARAQDLSSPPRRQNHPCHIQR